ncbi:aldo/keto reductase [Emcibacter sp.]|uniref:aldo/keto reductase n=1 Tax=Emcibacter sp. TaxID=1979954 RepID=UPI002AA8C9CB|nr:aldo/keto reductase [Emcibacter sp.]
MKARRIGDFNVGEIGLGCMNLSHAYGVPPTPEAGQKILLEAFDLGITHFDTAALYGFGRNEELVGPSLKPIRDQIMLASKCGMQGIDGKRVIDNRPETIRKTLEDSLRRLQTEVIDLYYLHRWDKKIPIEDSIGEMSRFVEEGKICALGLSEVSADTLRKAHGVHPIAAVQTEYSLWTRNAEIKMLDACEELGVAFVAFSPLARGFLTDTDLHPEEFAEKDIRRGMPRFQEPNFSRNAALLMEFRAIAEDAGCTAAQLALAWVLNTRPFTHVIPGTTSIAHLKDDVKAGEVELSSDIIDRLEKLINQETISGPRYPAATQAEIDTEEFTA